MSFETVAVFNRLRHIALWSILCLLALGACAAPTPVDYDPKVVDGLTSSMEALLQLYPKLEANMSKSVYGKVSSAYGQTLTKLKSVRYRAASRPQRTSVFDRIFNYFAGDSDKILPRTKQVLSSAVVKESVSEPTDICAPPSAAELRTTSQYSLRSLDSAIQTLDKMRECHMEKGLNMLRIDVFQTAIATYMSNAIFNEQALKLD